MEEYLKGWLQTWSDFKENWNLFRRNISRPNKSKWLGEGTMTKKNSQELTGSWSSLCDLRTFKTEPKRKANKKEQRCLEMEGKQTFVGFYSFTLHDLISVGMSLAGICNLSETQYGKHSNNSKIMNVYVKRGRGRSRPGDLSEGEKFLSNPIFLMSTVNIETRAPIDSRKWTKDPVKAPSIPKTELAKLSAPPLMCWRGSLHNFTSWQGIRLVVWVARRKNWKSWLKCRRCG